MSIGQRHVFSWLHLSDLHFGHGDSAYAWDQKSVLDSLISDVEEALRAWPELPRPQAIMVTGDIAFSGSALSSQEYEEAERFLVKITTLLGIERKDVYLVPGNHDVQRTVRPDLVEEVRSGARIDDVMLDSSRAAALLSRQANYKSFADKFAVRDQEVWSEKISIADFGDIHVVGLNSALISQDDEDFGKLRLTGRQRAQLASSCKNEVRLVLSHHPVTDGWLAEEDSIRPKIQQNLTIHLCGHVHDPRVELISSAGATHHIRVVAAAAHRDQKEATSGKDSHGYNFSSLILDPVGDLKLRTWPRRWFPNWNNFHVDHLGVPDRRFHDDKSLGKRFEGSGLTLDIPENIRVTVR